MEYNELLRTANLSDQSDWYTEWSLFPTEIDVIPEMSDVSTKQEVNLIDQYNKYTYLGIGDPLSDSELSAIEPKILTASKYNKLAAAVLAVQDFFLHNIGGWVAMIWTKIIGSVTDDFETNKTFHGLINKTENTISEFKGSSSSPANTNTIEGAKKLLDSTITTFKGNSSSAANTSTIEGTKKLMDNSISSFTQEYNSEISKIRQDFITNAETSSAMKTLMDSRLDVKFIRWNSTTPPSDSDLSGYDDRTFILVPVNE